MKKTHSSTQGSKILKEAENDFEFQALCSIMADAGMGERCISHGFTVNCTFDKKCPRCEKRGIESKLVQKKNMLVCGKCSMAFDADYYKRARELYLKTREKIRYPQGSDSYFEEHREDIRDLYAKVVKRTHKMFGKSVRFLSDKRKEKEKPVEKIAEQLIKLEFGEPKAAGRGADIKQKLRLRWVTNKLETRNEECFDVGSVKEAIKLLSKLERNWEKGVISTCGTLEVFKDGKWIEYKNEQGEDIHDIRERLYG